ncbi:MAG: division/cell wall cluster transcriptional repressor MraZ [Acidimicrobiales bacterium]
MGLFVSHYEHNLDGKGRLILPARYRAELDGSGYLGPHHEACLALWRKEDFERTAEEMLRSATDAEGRDNARLWAGDVWVVEIDKFGRMPIPARLQAFAGLRGQVLVRGALDHVEIWDPAQWRLRETPAEARLSGQMRK